MPRMRFAGAVAAVVAALTGLAAAQGAPQGSLTQPRGSDGCAKSYTRPNEACLQVPFLLDARDVATDEGGNFVYVVTSGGLHVLASPFWMRRELTVLPGKAGCWINDVRQTECSELAGSVLDLSSVALSPDGQSLYVGGKGHIGVFSRNTRTGVLFQRGCMSSGGDECARDPVFSDYSQVRLVVSPEGRNVYALGRALTVFRRSPGDGTLTGIDCFESLGSYGCSKPRALETDAIAISLDGRNVYTGGGTFLPGAPSRGAITIFDRKRKTGKLSQRWGKGACISDTGRLLLDRIECKAAGKPLRVVRALTVSPDGRSLYAAVENAVLGFDRAKDGGLTYRECWAAADQPYHCKTARGIRGASSVAVTPDDRFVYVGTNAETIVAFKRRIDGSLTQLPGPYGCVSSAADSGCRRAKPIAEVRGLAANAYKRLYAASGYAGLTIFDVDY